jgi:transcriptional regulator of acetoin/glycerol metabolism
MGNPYFGFKKDRAKTYALWERFNVGALEPEALSDPYERLLIEDWRRCADLRIDVARKVGVRLSEEEFRALLEDGQQLLDRARPVIDRTSSCLFDVPGILILADSTGTILYVAGDPEVRRRAAEGSGIVEGSRWLESVAGTNGLGSALTKKQPVHVFSAEHYCEGWHRWTCAATPILGADEKEPVGVIDFTTIDKDYRDQALALTWSLAATIQADLRLEHQLERNVLIQQYNEMAARYGSDALVVVDRRGCAVRHGSGPAAQRFAEQNAFQRMAEGAVRDSLAVVMPGSDRRVGTAYVLGGAKRAPAHVPSAGAGTVSIGDFVTADPTTARVISFVEKAAASDLNLLILGETGTGKELIARYVHGRSRRATGPYVAVNCGAVSRELMASSFFGYVAGAFTGADPKGRKGFFEAAHGGTLFLDEVGELPLEIQAGLRRVLEDGSFQRVGSDRTSITDCRIIAATNRDLQSDIARGAFRSDLYYRLNVVQVSLPPLRERTVDTKLLARRFVEQSCAKQSLPPLRITSEAEERLLAYPWPGNVRELRNVIEAAVICARDEITLEDLPPVVRHCRPDTSAGAPEPDAPRDDGTTTTVAEKLRDYERRVILAALDKYRRVNLVAKELGMSRSNLYRKFEALGIDHHRYR